MEVSLGINTIIWLGIIFCISQSAMFSGLNLAIFSVSRLRLEVEDASGNKDASKVLAIRKDSNFTLTTILWGNVGVNVLLALLSNSFLTGVFAFLFSTVVITLVGEILPQAYFSRNAIQMASLFSPILKMYQIILYPISRPTAKMLDFWLGKEGIQYFREKAFRQMIKKHIEAEEVDVDRLEGLGAMNFLAIDDLFVSQEGETIDPKSIISLPMIDGRPVFPRFDRSHADPFLQKIQASGKKWVIIIDPSGSPQFVLDSDGFLRAAWFESDRFNPYTYCHIPIIVYDQKVPLGNVISKFRVHQHHPENDVIDQDIILVWEDVKRVITGADILGRLLRGITIHETKNGKFII
ncbi:MAG: DUF21 domain-containing protein [Thermodesulfobacteriota bacterium]|nr:DUF21 domain-containing protein [Thermodesulfobacteriota bacterium]